MKIFISGVGCIGKTTIGAKLAEQLGFYFFDLDQEIEIFFGTSIEKLQNKFLTNHSYRNEASKALVHILSRTDIINSVIALPPSGLMGGYWRIVKKTKGIIIVLIDRPENILNRITFYDIDSQLLEKKLTEKEKRFYLKEIKKDITYFGKTYVRADLQVDICGCDISGAVTKVEQGIKSYLKEVSDLINTKNVRTK